MSPKKKKKNLKHFNRLKTPKTSERTRNRKETGAGSLKERFQSNIRMIKKTVWQDEKDFTHEVPVNLQNNRVYGKGKKSNISNEILVSSTNKMSKRSWSCYRRHLHKELFPAIEKLVKTDDWVFAQDGAPTRRSNWVQDFFKTRLKRRFIRAKE